nr:PREDICTED: non-specific lipid-transfer protein A-like [Daucus carota subsp. sativus]
MATYLRIACSMVVLALVVNLMAEQGEALSCADLGPSVTQCAPFATGAMSQPTNECCSAVKQVYSMAQTPQDRKTLCQCLKQSSSAVPGVQLSSVAAIPKICGLGINIPTNPNYNCDTVN